MKKLSGKTAVVTGAARGIGLATAERLLHEGANVALTDLSLESLEQATRGWAEADRFACFACDVTDGSQVEAMVAAVQARLGPVDILVNNAGLTRDAMFHKMTMDQWDQVLAVNLGGAYHCCKAVIGGMRERNYGKIVNFASVSAYGNMGQVNYGAAKAAIIGFTKSLAKESARKHITVNAVVPSYIDTVMMRSVPEAVLNRFIEAIPMGRLGLPEEVASVVQFLCSDDSSFVTGECIVISGGSYM